MLGTPAVPATPWPVLREELRLEPAGSNPDGSPAWHICDPVRNLFFRVGWLEFEFLRRWSLGEAARIAQDVSRHTALAPEADDVDRFQGFLANHQLLRTPRSKPATPPWRWLLHNYLFIRIPLVRPQRWLTRLLPWLGWLYTRGFVAATTMAAVAGITLAARQWDSVQANLRGALSWEGAAAFALALLASKLLHELGHALMATRHGVRVGHMGVALLVLWPMPYTDTGESWKLQRARNRFAIASAGICAELVLAAWCTLAWAFVADGNLRSALFFLATTAWVLTLAVNASPFMRFDGYYMLTDALDFPGLHERAGQHARRALRRGLLGLRSPSPESMPDGQRRALVAFAFATWAYRLVLFVGIALVVYHTFFKALGVVLFAVEIGVFVVRPLVAELRVWWSRRREIVPGRRLALAACLGLGAAVVLVPWHGAITVPGVVRAGFEQPVYSPYAARLVALEIREGQSVTAGQPLLTLDAPAQGNERDKATALAAAYDNAARGALGLEERAAAQLALAEQQASRYSAERQARSAELQRLQLVAGRAGTVRDIDPLLQPGAWVASSQLLAMVVDPRRFRVDALVPERERQRLQVTSGVTVVVKGRTERLQGRIVAMDDSPIKKLPHLLLAQSRGGPVPLNPALPEKDLKPGEAWFRVTVEGAADADLRGVRECVVHLDGTAESLAARWLDAAVSVFVQQAGF